jgi:prevent-host-death family protein
MIMKSVNVADAKARLSELIEEAGSGETICITRRGKPVARLTAIETPRKRIDPEMLRAVTEGSPWQTETAGDFVRRMRDEDRY